MTRPQTRREMVVDTYFGTKVEDPYRWLEDAHSEEVKSWMKLEDASASAYLASLPKRDDLIERLGRLLYIEQQSSPAKRGDRYFYAVKPADKEKWIHYVREGKSGRERVLVDANTLSLDGSISVGSVVPSFSGKWVVYFEHPNNADKATLRTIDVSTGQLSKVDTMEGLRYTYPSWARDDSGFYYLWLPNDPAIPPNELVGHGEIRFHRMGSDVSSDVTVHPKTGDPAKFLHAQVSHDGSQLFVYESNGWARNTVRVKELTPNAEFRTITPDENARYTVITYKQRAFILTNEGADRFRLFATDRDHFDRSAWQELIPEHESAVLEDASVVGGRLILRYLKNAYSEVQVRDLNGHMLRTVELPGIGTATSLLGSEDDDEAYYEFSSFTHPREIYAYDVRAGAQQLYYRTPIDVDTSRFEVRQERAKSKDGTEVPYFIVHEAGRVPKNARVLLSGYGGFDVPMLPQFSSTLFPWLEAGGVFVLANLRGGGEFGRAWHEAGMGHRKQNVFDDFIAVAEALQRQGVTVPSKLAISGRSNGGLLVGAAMTQRPELFGAVLCGVPLLDMVRFAEVGLGTAWVPEYGSVENEQDFNALYAYSPYHQLRDGVRYPPVLMLSADTDDRVDPMHARKFVAKLSAVDGARAYLRIEMQAGHGGADLRKKLIERTADEYAFLMDVLAP